MTVTAQVATLQSEPREILRGQLAAIPTPVAPRPGLIISPVFIGDGLATARQEDGTWAGSVYIFNNHPTLGIVAVHIIGRAMYWFGGFSTGQVYRFSPGDEEATLVATFAHPVTHTARLTDETILVATTNGTTETKIYSSANDWGLVATIPHISFFGDSFVNGIWEVGAFSEHFRDSIPAGRWWTNNDGTTKINNDATAPETFNPISANWSREGGLIAILPDGRFVYQTLSSSARFGIAIQSPGTQTGTLLRSLCSNDSPDYLPSPIVTHVESTFHLTYSDALFMGGGHGAGRIFTVSMGSHSPSITVWPGLTAALTHTVNDAWQDLWEVNTDTGHLTWIATLPRRDTVDFVTVADDGRGVPVMFVGSKRNFGTFPSNFDLYRTDIYEIHGNEVVHVVDQPDTFNNGGYAGGSSVRGQWGFGYAFPGTLPPPRGAAQQGAQVGKLHADP